VGGADEEEEEEEFRLFKTFFKIKEER